MPIPKKLGLSHKSGGHLTNLVPTSEILEIADSQNLHFAQDCSTKYQMEGMVEKMSI